MYSEKGKIVAGQSVELFEKSLGGRATKHSMHQLLVLQVVLAEGEMSQAALGGKRVE